MQEVLLPGRHGEILSTFEEMTAGNILIGGVIGLGIDAARGAINRYDPPEVKIAMQRIPGCGGSKSK